MENRLVPPLPGGYGRSSLVVGERAPRARSGKGYELMDELGNRLVDLNNNFTVLVHGHSHPAIVEEAQRVVSEGVSFGLPNEAEIAHAEALLARMPTADQVRYTNSGTEAVMTAIRLARAATGRDKVLVIAEAYHGTSDAALAGLGEHGRRGVPDGVLADVVLVEANDVAGLRRACDEHADRLAAILIDLMPNRAGLVALTSEFVAAARELATRIGAFLVVDEVVSFRLARGGMQEWYELTPDLTVLGKIIGGGFPVGAVAGPERFMELLNPLIEEGLIHGGTFSGNPLSMRAGRRALELLDDDSIAALNDLGDSLRGRLAAAIRHLPWEVRGAGSLLKLMPVAAPSEAAALRRMLWWVAYRRGLVLMPTGLIALSTPMDEGLCDRIVPQLVGGLEEIEVSRVRLLGEMLLAGGDGEVL